MAGDPEIEAMSAVAGALSSLDQEAQRRVLAWAANRYGVVLAEGGRGDRNRRRGRDDVEAQDDTERVEDGVDGSEYEDFADLYDAANPQTEGDRVLVGAYWIQVLEGEGSFRGYAVNEALRNMGHGVSNVTRSCDRLQAQEPALVRQMAKTGKSRQGRKTYKLTNAGIKAVEGMLS